MTAIRISADYPATDGSMPERIEIEIDSSELSASAVMAFVRTLMTVPARIFPDQDDGS